MTEQPETIPVRMKPWLRVLLGVSLALNLLVAGVVGGAMVMHGKWYGHRPPHPDMVAGPLTRALDRDDRRAIGRQMWQAYRQNPEVRGQMRAEFDGLVADIETVPFDAGAVAGRMERQRGLFRDRLELGQRLLLERLSAMSDAERAAYAGRLREGLQHHRNKRHHHDEE